MLSDDAELQADVFRFLQTATKDGGWFDATRIGLEAGFDRRYAAAGVRWALRDLINQGKVECDKSDRPIIYRAIIN